VGHCDHPKGRPPAPPAGGQATEALAPLFSDANVICLVGLSISMPRTCCRCRMMEDAPPCFVSGRPKGIRFPNRSLVAKIHAFCMIGCLTTLSRVGRGALVGRVGTPDQGQLSAPQWVWERYGEICTAPASDRGAAKQAGPWLTNRESRNEDEPCKRSPLRTG